MSDPFGGVAVGRESPATHAIASAASDSVDLDPPCRAVYVGTGGNVKVTTVGGETVTFESVPDGFVLPVSCTRLWSTGTTAPTKLIALY